MLIVYSEERIKTTVDGKKDCFIMDLIPLGFALRKPLGTPIDILTGFSQNMDDLKRVFGNISKTFLANISGLSAETYNGCSIKKVFFFG